MTPDIPDGEADVLVFNCLHIKSDGGDGGDDFSELELVQDGGLTGCIETHHQNSHLFLGKQPAEELRERKPHFSIEFSWRNEEGSK